MSTGLAAQTNITISSAVQLRDNTSIAALQKALDSMVSSKRQSRLPSIAVNGSILDPQSLAPMGTFTSKFRGLHHSIISTVNNRVFYRYVSGSSAKSRLDGVVSTTRFSGIIEDAPHLVPLFDHWMRFNESTVKVFPSTDSMVDGTSCLRIQLSIPLKVTIGVLRVFDEYVYIDKSTGLLKALEFGETDTLIYSPNRLVRVIYEQYRKMGDLFLPSRVSLQRSRITFASYQIDSVDSTQTIVESDLVF
jgi:hypothetical protein